MNEFSISNRDFAADLGREIAIRTADAGKTAILRYFRDLVLEDTVVDGVLSQDAEHPGDPGQVVDAAADEACQQAHHDAINDLRELLVNRAAHQVYVSEEGGTPTRVVQADTMVTRVDPNDGTTRGLHTLLGFGVAATVDFIRDPRHPATHLGGCIASGHIDVSWISHSRRSRYTGEMLRRDGSVFLRLPALGPQWSRLPAMREDRAMGTVAAIATSAKRFNLVKPIIDRVHASQRPFYSEAGNPILPALLVGQLDAVVETEHTTLHDSAFLIPFSLLGGTIKTWDGQDLDYLSLYEANAANLDPKAKPIPPYVAFHHTNPVTPALTLLHHTG